MSLQRDGNLEIKPFTKLSNQCGVSRLKMSFAWHYGVDCDRLSSRMMRKLIGNVELGKCQQYSIHMKIFIRVIYEH